MQSWIISANGKIYDHEASFAKNEHIDWRQRGNFQIGDTVYIYCTRPIQKIMYKTVVKKVSMNFSECTDDKEFWKDLGEYEKSKSGKYMRLDLVDQTDKEELSFNSLKAQGLKGVIQGPRKVDANLLEYIEKYFLENAESLFPDSVPEKTYEGAVKTVKVNRYERNSIARQKCIEYHGNECSICGLSFEDKYGELGEGYIQVHHIIPISEIGEEYQVDYKNDLIPVCPNCHAMLHRKLNGKTVSIDELKSIVKEHSK